MRPHKSKGQHNEAPGNQTWHGRLAHASQPSMHGRDAHATEAWTWFYARRTARRHRDHRHHGWDSVADIEQGAQVIAGNRMLVEPPPDGCRVEHLSLGEQVPPPAFHVAGEREARCRV